MNTHPDCPPPSHDQTAKGGLLQSLVLAICSLRYIRFGLPYWTHRYRWLYLPWQWAYKKSNHGGWFFLTRRTPIEMIVGVENLSRWQNRRNKRSQNDLDQARAAQRVDPATD
jgi:hypothetical protein